MKKLIAMILALALCLGGCADTAQTQPTEESTTTTEQTTAAPEMTEVAETTEVLTTQETTEESETTETTEVPETTEEPETQESSMPEMIIIKAQGALTETKISQFLSTLPTDGTTIDYMEGMNGGFWEIGLGLELILYTYHTDAIREDVNYLQSDRERLLFAWQMANFDPNVQKIMQKGENSYTAIAEDTFVQYYQLLFNRAPVLSMSCDIEAWFGRFDLRDGEVRCYYTTESGQFAPPMPENVKLTYEDGAYYLRGDVKLEREYYTYPGTYCGKIEIRLHKNDVGFYFHSLVLTDLIDEVKPDEESGVPLAYADKRLDELIALVADGESMSDEMKIAMQVCLNDYVEPVYWMLDYWRYQPDIDAANIDMQCNYLESFENRAQMAFFGAINAESVWDVGVYDDGTIGEVTGGVAVTQTSMKESYRELFGDELDIERMSELERLQPDDYLVYGSYITGWSCSPSMKNVSCARSERGENQMIISCVYLTESCDQDWNYAPANVLEYRTEFELCRLNFTFEKNQNGYRLISLTASEIWT